MSLCKYCNQEMDTEHTSCLPYLKIDGQFYPRIKFGSENRWINYKKRLRVERAELGCYHCGCPIGSYHHFGCLGETDPINGVQVSTEIRLGKNILPVEDPNKVKEEER